jgi:hypothetical protein
MQVANENSIASPATCGSTAASGSRPTKHCHTCSKNRRGALNCSASHEWTATGQRRTSETVLQLFLLSLSYSQPTRSRQHAAPFSLTRKEKGRHATAPKTLSRSCMQGHEASWKLPLSLSKRHRQQATNERMTTACSRRHSLLSLLASHSCKRFF